MPYLDVNSITTEALKDDTRAWGSLQEPQEFPEKFTSKRLLKSCVVLYSQCQEHHGCFAKYRTKVSLGTCGEVAFKPHSAESMHAFAPALVHSMGNAVTKVGRREILKRAKEVKASGRRKLPLDIQGELIGTPHEFSAGRAVQRLCWKAVTKLPRPPDFSIDEFTAWCEKRKVELGEHFRMPREPDRLWVVWYEIRGEYVAVALVNFKFIDTFLETWKESGMTLDGFVTQCDYTHTVIWRGYKLGLISLSTYKRARYEGACAKDRKWRPCALPGVYMLSAEEDSDHYKIGFRYLKEVLRTMITFKGLAEPKEALLCQANGDWAPALWKEHTTTAT